MQAADRGTEPWDRAELVRLAPGIGVLLTWLALMPMGGGFAAADRLPAGLVLLGLLAVAVAGSRRLLPAPREARWALLCFAAFTAWSFLSIAWSDAPGDAWEAADTLLVTLLGAWTLALVPWRPSTAWIFIGVFCAGACVACAVPLVQALGEADLTGRFTDLRWNEPLNYPNTAAAFALLAAVPALVAAARPDLPVVAAAVAQAVASFLAGYSLLAQSRGSILGAAAALLIVTLLVPFRWRFVLHAALLGLVMFVVAGPAIDLYDAADAGRASSALEDAARAILVGTAIGAAGGLLLALAGRRVVLGDRGRRWARITGIATAVACIGLAGGVAAAHDDTIRRTLDDQWQFLTHPGSVYTGVPETERDLENRLADANPRERYDYWRVSVDAFRDAPLGGMGAGGFEHRYTPERRYISLSRYPHNLVMRVLGENGLVGVALMAGLLAALVLGLLRGRRGLSPPARALVAAAAGVSAYFFAHGAFDWVEVYPVLSGPALGLPLMALAARREPGAPGRLGRPLIAAAGAVAVAAAVALTLPWLSVRYIDRGVQLARTNPAAALADFRRAADLNPLDARPLDLEGGLAIGRGDLGRARAAFAESRARQDAWLSHLGLALVAAAQGDRAAGVREAHRALRLNPMSEPLQEVVERLEHGKGRVDPARMLRDALATPQFSVERIS
jgi:hypothetical protein